MSYHCELCYFGFLLHLLMALCHELPSRALHFFCSHRLTFFGHLLVTLSLPFSICVGFRPWWPGTWATHPAHPLSKCRRPRLSSGLPIGFGSVSDTFVAPSALVVICGTLQSGMLSVGASFVFLSCDCVCLDYEWGQAFLRISYGSICRTYEHFIRFAGVLWRIPDFVL